MQNELSESTRRFSAASCPQTILRFTNRILTISRSIWSIGFIGLDFKDFHYTEIALDFDNFLGLKGTQSGQQQLMRSKWSFFCGEEWFSCYHSILECVTIILWTQSHIDNEHFTSTAGAELCSIWLSTSTFLTSDSESSCSKSQKKSTFPFSFVVKNLKKAD